MAHANQSDGSTFVYSHFVHVRRVQERRTALINNPDGLTGDERRELALMDALLGAYLGHRYPRYTRLDPTEVAIEAAEEAVRTTEEAS